MKTSQLKNIVFTGGFWQKFTEINRNATIPRCKQQSDETGRIEAMKLNWQEGQPNRPHIFWDSDVAKWMEAAAYSLQNESDPVLKDQLEEVIDIIGKSQGSDGYFNSYFQQIELYKRWTNLTFQHELYCAGHLMEAAVAHYEATGSRKFLDIMCHYADYIDSVFGLEDGKKKGYPGHEEIELALVKLADATGNEKYFNLAKYFVDQRGTTPNYFEEEQKGNWKGCFEPGYFQAHKPVREQDEAIGHAVRAVYLYCGMVDVAVRTNDKDLMQSCRKLWENIVSKKMYVTGGIGSSYHGETFTKEYDLPNEEAYAETCAAIGLVFFSWRMFQAEKDARYVDVLERALYNGANSGISLDGKYFFYVNPLACYPDGTMANGKHHEPRPDWFNCSCCPPNVARLRASVGQYFYEVEKDTIYVNLFNTNKAELEIKGQKVTVIQQTDYPWQGNVSITIECTAKTVFKLAVRIPGWCRNHKLLLNGKPVDAVGVCGYSIIDRTWNSGDKVELVMEMSIDVIYADPKVRHDAGRVALQRGPLVYCIEEADNGGDLNSIRLDTAKPFAFIESESFGGVVLIEASGFMAQRGDWGSDLYRTQPPVEKTVKLTAIPYFCWGNRKFGEMLVWVRK